MKQRKTLTVVTTTFVLGCSLMFGGGTALADTYQVKSGDSLYSIANSHKITVEALKRVNQLSNDKIFAGQILTLPENYTTHQVLAGDTLYKLAKQYHCSVKEIKQQNNLHEDTILTGTTLKIPTTQNNRETNAIVTSSRGTSYQRSYTQAEWDMLAQVVYGEARGESYNGQVAVAAVVLNRVAADGFPNTMQDVIFQKNAFTCVSDGQYYLTPNRTAYLAALEAMQGNDPTNGCLYYWNPITATSRWIWTREIETTIGNHVFGN